MSSGIHQKDDLQNSVAGSSAMSSSQHNASSRRNSSGDPLMSSRARPSLGSYTSRGAAPPISSVGTARQRSLLLRSVDHLHIDAQPSLNTTNSNTDGPSSPLDIPFNQFDLIQPPEYKAKKGRGWTFGDDVRNASSSGFYNASTPNASQVSLSSQPRFASQGKAKAVAAAAKIRKQLKRPSSSNDLQRYTTASSSSRADQPPSILNPTRSSSTTPLDPLILGPDAPTQRTADCKGPETFNGNARPRHSESQSSSSSISIAIAEPEQQTSSNTSSTLRSESESEYI
jgi:hypothetical protein